MDVRLTCKCGMVHRFGSKVRCVKCQCGQVVHGDCTPIVAKPVETDEHGVPLWVKLLKRFSKPSDVGPGDTFQRIAAKVGGEYLKDIAESLGMPCGCTDRQAEWNRLYPY